MGITKLQRPWELLMLSFFMQHWIFKLKEKKSIFRILFFPINFKWENSKNYFDRDRLRDKALFHVSTFAFVKFIVFAYFLFCCWKFLCHDIMTNLEKGSLLSCNSFNGTKCIFHESLSLSSACWCVLGFLSRMQKFLNDFFTCCGF